MSMILLLQKHENPRITTNYRKGYCTKTSILLARFSWKSSLQNNIASWWQLSILSFKALAERIGGVDRTNWSTQTNRQDNNPFLAFIRLAYSCYMCLYIYYYYVIWQLMKILLHIPVPANITPQVYKHFTTIYDSTCKYQCQFPH